MTTLTDRCEFSAAFDSPLGSILSFTVVDTKKPNGTAQTFHSNDAKKGSHQRELDGNLSTSLTTVTKNPARPNIPGLKFCEKRPRKTTLSRRRADDGGIARSMGTVTLAAEV